MGANAGQHVANALCFPILGIVQHGQEGDVFGAISQGVCPMSIGGIAEGIQELATGDTGQGLGHLLGGLNDPLAPGLANWGTEAATNAIYNALTDTSGTDNLQTDTAKPQTTAEAYNELQNVYANARNNTAAQEDLARRSAMKAALNQGASGAKASALAGSNTPIGNAARNLSTSKSNWINQKNAELERKAQADALAKEAKNLDNAKDRLVGSSILGGGATGTSGALSIFGNSVGGGN